MNRAVPGMAKTDIDTPALLVDLDVMEDNMDRMAARFSGTQARLRPHAKTHKTPVIAHEQIRRGACGITCAKLGEAEAMVSAGVADVLIANQVVGDRKLRLLVDLARGARKLTVAVDGADNVDELSCAASSGGAGIGVLVEVDVGMGRCGVRSPEQAVSLAIRVARARGLTFEGLQGYEGQCVFIESLRERERQAARAYRLLADAVEAVQHAGLEVRTVGGGGTGTYALAARSGVVNEVQAGSYVFMDTRYRSIEGVDFGCSLSVLTTVLSRPDKSTVVVDCGLKAISTEFGLPAVKGLGGLACAKASEEHLVLEVRESLEDLRVGDKIELIPSHCCTTVNLHDAYYATRAGVVEAVWPILARGKSY